MIVSRFMRKYCCHLALGVMLWCFGAFSSALHAQTEEHHFPFGMKPMVYRALPLRSIVIDKNDLRGEDMIGITTQTNLNCKNSGEWNTYSREFRTWIVKLHVENVSQMALVLSDVRLTGDERLFVYNANGVSLILDKSNVPESGIVPLQYLKGSDLVVEFDVPVNESMMGSFSIESLSVVPGHAKTNALMPESNGRKESCYTCINGDFWTAPKKSVVRILAFRDANTIMCSGVLINNTAFNAKPYILTAEHCITNQAEADRAIFIFNDEDLNCDGVQSIKNTTVISGVLRASSYDHDFSLIELPYHVPLGFQPYFSGWDVSGSYAEQVSCIHHPLAGTKQVSIENEPIGFDNFTVEGSPARASNAFWHIERWDTGLTEGGSSGAALFDKQHRVIGILSGGSSTCANPEDDYFARLSEAWEASGDSSQQLKCWLDPINSGKRSIDGMAPFEKSAVTCDTLSNLAPGEITTLIPYESGTGYYGGCNSAGITAYAEEFVVPDSTVLTGVNLYVGSMPQLSEGGIVLTIHSDNNGIPGRALYEQYIPYSKLHLYMNYVELYPFVAVKDKFYVGYSLNCSDGDVFSLEQTYWRSGSENTAWAKLPTGWMEMSATHPQHFGSSLYIEAITCRIANETQLKGGELQINLYPNPATSMLVCSLQSAVENEFQISIFDSQGREEQVTIDFYNNDFLIDVSGLARGIYLVLIHSNTGSHFRRFVKT